jgi:hypothetical protein
MGLNSIECKNYISALKNGVVPEGDLSAISIGRNALLEEYELCMDVMDSSASFVKFLCGEYGSGKTFMLRKIMDKALNRIFVVSSIQVGRNMRINNFGSIYYNIMHNLFVKHIKGEKSSFENIFDFWIYNLRKKQATQNVSDEINTVMTEINNYNSSFARALTAYVRARITKDNSLAQSVVSWITGESNIPAGLKRKFEVIGTIDKHNALDFFKGFSRLIKLLGYSGLVVLVDELECVMTERSDIRKVCYENIRSIIDMSYSGELKNCLFVFAGTPRLFSNNEKGIKTYVALDQRIQPIRQLKNFDTGQIGELTNKIVDIYAQGYNFKPDMTNEDIINSVLLSLRKQDASSQYKDIDSVVVRMYIIYLIEMLDELRQPNP